MSAIDGLDSPLLTLREAARYLRVSEREIHYLRKGTPPLRVVRIGARVFIHIQELRAFIQTSMEIDHGKHRT